MLPERKEIEIREIQIPAGITEARADKVLADCLEDFTRSKVQRLLEAGSVKRGGCILKKNDTLRPGDHLCVTLVPDAAKKGLGPVKGTLDVVYEDEALIVLNKASHTTVHPGSGTGEDTLVHGLLYHCKGKLSQGGDPSRPGVVHRLDKETTGLIVFAKEDAAYTSLTQQFKDRTVKKEYVALVRGVPRRLSGSIQAGIQRHEKIRTKMQVATEGRFAHTYWQVERTFLERFSVLRCFLFTGRTHQIRVHLSHIRHPIIGDTLYGYRFQEGDPIQPSRVLLHAHRLAFFHPLSQEPLNFEAPLPADFQSAICALEAASREH